MTPGQWSSATGEPGRPPTPTRSWTCSRRMPPTGPASFREPFLGSDAIRSYWQRGADTQREVTVCMGRPFITGDPSPWSRGQR